jgi:hypothetical protein
LALLSGDSTEFLKHRAVVRASLGLSPEPPAEPEEDEENSSEFSPEEFLRHMAQIRQQVASTSVEAEWV